MGWREGGIVETGEIPWKVTGKRGVKAIFNEDASIHPVTSVVVWTKIRYKDWRPSRVEVPYCSYNKRRQKRSCYNNRLFAPTVNMAPRISIVRGSVTNAKYANTTGWSGDGVTFFNVLLKEWVSIPATGQSWRSKGCCSQQIHQFFRLQKINRSRRSDAIRTAWFDMWCTTTFSLSVPSHCVEPVTQRVLHFDMFDESRDMEVEYREVW